MDGEISKGTWIGATILAIVAILGLAFAVYGIARSLVNNSSADFVNTVDSASQSGFNDFDDTVVSGLQVRSAIDTYEGDKIAILVNTAGVQTLIKGESDPLTKLNDARKEKLNMDSTKGTVTNVLALYDDKYYVNYNALLEVNPNSTTINGVTGNFLTVGSTKEGFLRLLVGFKIKTGTNDLQFNLLKTNYKTTGQPEFIANGSNFSAKLIKDSSNVIVGIMFTQIYVE